MITLLYSITAGASSSKIKKIKSNQGIWTSSYNAGISGFLVFIFSSFIFFLMGLFIQKHPLMLATRFGVGYGIIGGSLHSMVTRSPITNYQVNRKKTVWLKGCLETH